MHGTEHAGVADPRTELIERLQASLPDAADQGVLEGMLRYLDRSSLWPSRVDGEGPEMVICFANEAERFRVPFAVLRRAWEDMRQGRRLDWSTWEALRER